MFPILIFILGVILIIVSFKASNKDDTSFDKILEREENIQYRDYDVEIIKIRKDMAETVLDIQREIEDLKLSISSIKKSYNDTDNNIEDHKIEKINLKEDVISSIDFSNKIDESNEGNIQSEKQKKVKALLNRGLSEDEICEKLSIGKGEILLIKSLLRK
ncbi:MAG: hypothetical protein E7212_05280 [Clostridium sartagoforme]|nr:hypothetical protein [Clostridium sartagoforme]